MDSRNRWNGGTGKGWQTLVERSLRLHLIPALGNRALPQIVRSDIVIAMDQIPKEQIANRRNIFAVARRFFRWAVSRGDIQISPMEGMETPKAVKPRDRWLSDSELPRIWNAARFQATASEKRTCGHEVVAGQSSAGARESPSVSSRAR